MITEEQKKAIFVCWMTDTEKTGERNVGHLIQYLSDNGLLKVENIPEFLTQKNSIIEADRKATEEMLAKRKPFTKEVADVIMEALTSAPESQMEARLKEKATAFQTSGMSLAKTYDFINEMSKENHISPFISSLCFLEPHYIRPEETFK